MNIIVKTGEIIIDNCSTLQIRNNYRYNVYKNKFERGGIMNSVEFYNSCWTHYLALENALRKVERYVSFETDNFECYSIEFIEQYLAICSEIDVVCKIYCEEIYPNFKCKDVLDYAYVILENRTDFKNAKVECNNIQLEPWKEWSTNPQQHRNFQNSLNVPPNWWSKYNKVKHERTSLDENGIPYYKYANLEYVLNSLAGLFVLCMNCYKELCEKEGDTIKVPVEPSKLFQYKGWEEGTYMLGNGVCIS